MRINTNVSALNAHRNLSQTQASSSESMAKLSSGFRINKAADDAAGLGIANQMRSTTRSLAQASRNAEQANSLLQIAEGSTGTVQKMLERVKELATQAASDTVDTDGRARIQKEFDSLVNEIDRTVDTTKFQGTKLLNGTAGTGSQSFSFMVSSSAEYAGQDRLSLSLTSLKASELGTASSKLDSLKTVTVGPTAASTSVSQTAGTLSDADPAVSGTYTGSANSSVNVRRTASAFEYSTDSGSTWTAFTGSTFTTAGATIDVTSAGVTTGNAWTVSLTAATAGSTTGGLLTNSSAQSTLTVVDAAINKVNEQLGDIGAAQNRIGYAMDNVKTAIQNFSAAESVIRDVDMAEEMTKFSKANILSQAGTAMLAQANQSSQGVLQLLRG